MIEGKQLGISDEWYTPKYIFDALDCRFDVDVASPKDLTYCYVPANRFIYEDSLSKYWHYDNFIWMNPPFGGRNGIIPWLEKLYQQGNGIALTPDRTSAPWWQEYAKKADCVLFINGKVKFIKPDGTNGSQPSNGTCLFAFGTKATNALNNASKNGLGLLFKIKRTEK